MCDCVGAKHGTSMAICPVVTPRSIGTRLWLRSLTSWRITSVHWYLHGIVCFRGVKDWKDLKGHSWEMVLVKAISGTKISLEVWSHSPFANPRSPEKHTHESSIHHYSLYTPISCLLPTSTNFNGNATQMQKAPSPHCLATPRAAKAMDLGSVHRCPSQSCNLHSEQNGVGQGGPEIWTPKRFQKGFIILGTSKLRTTPKLSKTVL